MDVPVRPRLKFFGVPSLTGLGEGSIPLPSKGYLLALYLNLANRDGEARRSDASRFLWPDQPNAFTNLRQLLIRLRALQERNGFEFVVADSLNLRFLSSQVDSDIAEFRALLPILDWENAMRFLDLYAGDLLAGLEAPEGDAQTWLEAQRTSFRDQLITAVSSLLNRPDLRANVQTAQLLSTRLLDIDSSQEIAYRTLMACYGATGQFDRVAATFERCKSLLMKEFGIEPAAETVNLFSQLTRRPMPSLRPQVADTRRSSGNEALPAILPKVVVLMPEHSRVPLATIASALLDDVIINLCMFKTVVVVAPSASWKFSKNHPADPEFAKFGINYVAQPTLLSVGGEIRLSVKLFQLPSRTIIWADSLPLSVADSASCFRGLALGLALSLTDAVERAETARFEQAHDASAYYWHLVGQKHLRKLNLPNVRQAKKAFRQSISADPEFAASRAGYAQALQREWLLLGRGDQELLHDAVLSAQQAVDIDHRDSRGYRELGLCNLYLRRWDESVAYYAEAESRSPHNADILSDHADALAHGGQPDIALAKIQRAIQLNPRPPEKYWWDIAGIYFQLGMYQKAIEAVERMDHPTPGLRIAAAAWAYLGQMEKAQACVAEFLEAYPNFDVAGWLAIVPDRNPDHTRHYEVGLRLAGF